MEDAADLGFSALEAGVDKYHDIVYDSVAAFPTKARNLTGRRRRKSQPAQNLETTKQVETVQNYDPRSTYRSEVNYIPYQDSYRAPKRDPSMSRYDDQNYYYGRQPDSYDPELGRAQGVARDGYAADGTSEYASSSRDRRHKGPRYLEYAPDGSRYGQGGGAAYASRSHDDLRSRRDRDYSDDDEEEDDRRVARRRSRHGSRRSSRHRKDDMETPDEVGQGEWKKWGATLAGAAVGAYGVHRGLKGSRRGGGENENILGTAVGAVVGGLIAREAEKEWYKHKATKETQMNIDEGGYRSKSSTR